MRRTIVNLRRFITFALILVALAASGGIAFLAIKNPTKFLQTLVDGVTVGSLYALIALGYTMVYGILQFINFAHSNVFMLGAWISFVIARAAGWTGPDASPPLYAIPVVLLGSMATCAIVGFIIEKVAYKPMRDAPRINVLVTAIGVCLLLESIGQLPFVFGTSPQPTPRLIPDAPLLTYEGANDIVVNFTMVDLMIIDSAIVLIIALEFLVYRSKIGLAMRAVSHDHRLASLMGVNVNRTISITFLIGSTLAAAAGFLASARVSALQQPSDASWTLFGLKAFVAAVVGGIGNIRGAMIGGLLIGLIEFFGSAYVSTNLRDVFVFLILILVLLIKPTGILGRPTLEKV